MATPHNWGGLKMFGQIGEFWDVFREGQAVKDAIKLKNQQVFIGKLMAMVGTIGVIGGSYGIDIHNFSFSRFGVDFSLHVSDAAFQYLAYLLAGVFGLHSVGATVASTDKIGLLPPKSKPAADVVPGDEKNESESVAVMAGQPIETTVQAVTQAAREVDSPKGFAPDDKLYSGGN